MNKALERLVNAGELQRVATSPVAGVDYARHQPRHIRFLPPDDRLPLWESDYKQMQENMIYGPSLPFAEHMKN